MKRSFSRFFSKFKPENLSNFVTGLVIAVLIILTMVFAGVESAKGPTADFTSNSLYSLSEKSTNIISSLNKDINIYTLYSAGNENRIVTALLESFASENSRIKLSNVDPSGSRQEISFVEDSASIALGSIVVALKDGSRYTVLSSGSLYITDSQTGETSFRAESKITTAINYVATGNIINVKMLYGHQETSDSELTDLKSYLDTMNYNVSRFDYLRSSEPLDAKTDILVAVSPKTDISADEYKAIKAFLQEGGTFIVMLDNTEYDKDTRVINKVTRNQDLFEILLEEYGLAIKNDIIACDDAKHTGLRSTTLVLDESELMQKLSTSGGNAVLSECSSLDILNKTDVVVKPLLYTDASCFANDIQYGINLRKGKNSSIGKFVVAAMSKKQDAGTLVLFSTSSFVKSSEFAISSNNVAAIDALSFANIGQPAIELEPKPLIKMFELKSGFMRFLWTALLVVILPALLLAYGVIRIIRRRRILQKRKK